MPGALAEGEVLVTLSCLAPKNLTFSQRRLLLSNQKNSVSIGRASKSTSSLESRMYNAYFDAPVMSRHHAELKFDSQSQTVFIRDIGSLHGTYHNDIKLRRDQSQALSNGDILKFGMTIDRGHEKFPQCMMKVALEFGERSQQSSEEARFTQPAIFQVPDDSESDDMDDADSHAAFSSIDDGDYDPVLQSGAAILAENGLELVEFRGFDTSDPIDLTSEPDLISEHNNPTSSSPLSNDSDLPSHTADCTVGTVELDDDVELGTLDHVSVAMARESSAPTTQVKQIPEVEIAKDNIPGMDGPLSEDQYLSAGSEIAPSMIRARSLGERSGKPEFFLAREQNKCYIKNSITPRATLIQELHETQPQEPRETQTQEETLVPGNTRDLEEAAGPSERTSKKRKAEQISDSVLAEAVPVEAAPAYKHARTAAEYVGLMAIGGVAVMTALIATAPTF